MKNTKQAQRIFDREKEMILLVRCNNALNGFSKAFRMEWAKRNFKDRIKFMQDILNEGGAR